MAISGNLRSMPFADLMQWIAMSQKSGTLVIKGRRFTKKILFRQGLVEAVTSNNPREHLGYFLVGWGYISEEELTKLLSLQQTQKVALGELLIQSGRMTRDEIDRIIRIKTEATVYDLMLWEEGEFFLLDDDMPRREFQGLALPVDHFLFEGARQADEIRRIRELIPDPAHIPSIAQAVDETTLSPQQLSMLWEVNGEQSIEIIGLHCRVPVFDVLSASSTTASGRGVRAARLRSTVRPGSPVRPGPRGASSSARPRTASPLVTSTRHTRSSGRIRERFAGIPEAVRARPTRSSFAWKASSPRPPSPPRSSWSSRCRCRRSATSTVRPRRGSCCPGSTACTPCLRSCPSFPGSKLKNQLIIHNLMQRGIIKIQESRAVLRREGSGSYRRP